MIKHSEQAQRQPSPLTAQILMMNNDNDDDNNNNINIFGERRTVIELLNGLSEVGLVPKLRDN